MNQQCKVCGEPAAGFHFGAFTCEGCKSFFGRTYNNQSSISECKNNGECVINKKNRTACKACRLRKCLRVGMSKSGSRYGRRSNWFKIHCLLQEQQQQAQAQGAMAAGLLRSHPYFPLFRSALPGAADTKSSESDSGASSADPDDELRSASALGCARQVASPLSDRDYFGAKKLPSPSSDSECFARRRLSASITLALPASPASLPAVSPGGLGATVCWPPPPLHALPDPAAWRELWLRGPPVADPEPISQEQPIDLSVRATNNNNNNKGAPPATVTDPDLSIDVGVEDAVKPVPLDLSREAKQRAPNLSLTS